MLFSTSVMTSADVEGLTIDGRRRRAATATAACTAPSMTRDQDRRAEALPEVPVRPRPAVPSARARRCPARRAATTTPVGVRASVHSTKTRAAPCRTWPRVSPTSFVPRSSSTTVPSALKRVGRHDAGRHARQRRVDRGLERAIEKCAFRQAAALRRQHFGLHRRRDPRPQQRVEIAATPMHRLAPGDGCLHRRSRSPYRRIAGPRDAAPAELPLGAAESRAALAPA